MPKLILNRPEILGLLVEQGGKGVPQGVEGELLL